MPSLGRHTLSVFVAATAAVLAPWAATGASASTLSAPSGLAPSSAGDTSVASQVYKDPVLSWGAVGGASRYQVELSRSDDWTDTTVLVSLPDSGVTGSPRFALPQTLLHGAYFWRVRAENGSGSSAWSSAAQVYKGWYDAPTAGPASGSDATTDWRPGSGGAGVDSAPIRMSWTALPDASSYELELSTMPTFPQPGTVQSGKNIDGATTVVCITTHTTFTPYSSVSGKDTNVDNCDLSSFDPGFSTIYWRVRGLDDSNSNAPADSETQSLLCFGVPGDTNVSSASQPSTSLALGSPSLTAQECSRWSDAVQIAYPVGGTGNYDAADATTGPELTLSCPLVSGSYACSDMPEIQWSPTQVDGEYPQLYKVTIADDRDFTNVERIYETGELTLTPRDQLPDNTAGQGYWVAVQGCTDPGSINPGCGMASVTHFTKQTARVGGLHASALPGGELFTWNDLLNNYSSAQTQPGDAAVEAVDYMVELARASDTDFSNPVQTLTVDRSCDVASSAANACYQPGVAGSDGPGQAQAVVHVADGDYIWRVVPEDVAGNHLRGSAAQNVSIDTTAPSFRLTDSSNHPDSRPLHIRASEPVSGVSGSSLHVISLTTGGIVKGALAATSPTSWTFSPFHVFTPGERYGLSVTSAITDTAGNLAVVGGTPVRISGRVDDKDRAWRLSSGWKRISSSSAWGGTFLHGASGSSATVRVVGSSISVYGCKAPRLGKMRIIVDGVVKSTRSMSQSFTSCGVLVWKGSVTNNALHTLRVSAVRGAIDLDRAVVS